MFYLWLKSSTTEQHYAIWGFLHSFIIVVFCCWTMYPTDYNDVTNNNTKVHSVRQNDSYQWNLVKLSKEFNIYFFITPNAVININGEWSI